MKLSDYLAGECIVILKASTKVETLDELAHVLADHAGLDFGQLRGEIQTREELMSTGIGHGLAIPHVRMPGAARASIAVGVSAAGISDYKSLDEKPVHIIVLIVAPQGQHETYIRLLAMVTDVLRHEELRERILQATSGEELARIMIGDRSQRPQESP